MYYENDCVLCIRYVSVCGFMYVCFMYLIHYKFFGGTFLFLK